MPSQDVVLGLYYTTRDRTNGKGEGLVFSDTGEVRRAFDAGELDLNARISVRLTEYTKNKETGEFVPSTKLWETTGGRALLSEILPKGLPFSNINKALKKKEISKLINVSFRKCGLKETVVFADKLLQSGFRLATKAGISICIDDMLVPKEKHAIIARAQKEVKDPRLLNLYESELRYFRESSVEFAHAFPWRWKQRGNAAPTPRWAARPRSSTSASLTVAAQARISRH